MRHFQKLWEEVKQLTDLEVAFVPSFGARLSGLDLDRILEAGLEVGLDKVTVVDGLLAVEGRQVLLYIPDQGDRIGDVLNGQLEAGKKVHVADCDVLGRMRAAGRFERYIATTRIDGVFHVVGRDYQSGKQMEGHTPLFVCMTCLSQLNYKGAGKSRKDRHAVRDNFCFAEFFETYSTVFPIKPRARLVDSASFRYPDNWAEISEEYRASVRWMCENCLIDLSDYRHLLHTHHRNGIPGDCSRGNLQALCVDCHRRQPYHGRVHVSRADMEIIARKRMADRQIYSTWDETLRSTDLALHGALGLARDRRWDIPRPGGVPGLDDPIGVHWLDQRLALSLSDCSGNVRRGWKVMTPSRFIAQYGG
jgi:hypothetical protein